MAKERIIDIYCPDCKAQGRDKLLFRTTSKTRGVVFAHCKGCKQEIKITLSDDADGIMQNAMLSITTGIGSIPGAIENIPNVIKPNKE